MNSTTRTISLILAAATTVAAVVLLLDRVGVVAIVALLMGLGLAVKVWFRPGKNDLLLSIGLVAIPIIAWFGTVQYVISTWESGEVVELVIDTDAGPHTARLWVMDLGEHPTVYYDAEAEAAASLLAGKPLQFTRAGETTTRTPVATRVEDLSEAEANLVLAAMQEKYGDRNDAATIWYVMLGQSQKKVPVVVNLVPL